MHYLDDLFDEEDSDDIEEEPREEQDEVRESSRQSDDLFEEQEEDEENTQLNQQLHEERDSQESASYDIIPETQSVDEVMSFLEKANIPEPSENDFTEFLQETDDPSEQGREFPEFDDLDGEDDPNQPTYPFFSVIYKFRPEYKDDEGMNGVRALFDIYCRGFDRLFASEIINGEDSKGMVLLFAGKDDADKADTLAELNQFMEHCPYLKQNFVEKWDVMDMCSPEAIQEGLLRELKPYEYKEIEPDLEP